MSCGVEPVRRLIEADMPISADAQHLNIDPGGLDRPVIFGAFLFRVGGFASDAPAKKSGVIARNRMIRHFFIFTTRYNTVKSAPIF